MNHIRKIVKLALINELQRNLGLHGFGVLLGLVAAFSWTKEGSESQFSAHFLMERTEEVQRFAEHGCSVLCLGCPEGMLFGIDYSAWSVGPQFMGAAWY